MCEFCGRVYCDIWYIFLIPQFFETPDDEYSPKVQFVQTALWIATKPYVDMLPVSAF